jgi:hypothetical protein
MNRRLFLGSLISVGAVAALHPLSALAQEPVVDITAAEWIPLCREGVYVQPWGSFTVTRELIASLANSLTWRPIPIDAEFAGFTRLVPKAGAPGYPVPSPIHVPAIWGEQMVQRGRFVTEFVPAYGYVTDVRAHDDALEAHVTWADNAFARIREGGFTALVPGYISPYRHRDGTSEPGRLIAASLTAHPARLRACGSGDYAQE